MSAVWACLTSDLRSHWRAWLAIALLITGGGGLVVTTASGARRTDTAYGRFLRASNASDVLVSPNDSGFPGYYPALRALPGVRMLGTELGVLAVVAGAHPGVVAIQISADGLFGTAIERPKLLAGRTPRPGTSGEVDVDKHAADFFHVRVGDLMHLMVPAPGSSPQDLSNAVALTERVVGIVVNRNGIVSVTQLDSSPTIVAPQAFLRQIPMKYAAFDGAFVRLSRGTTEASFEKQAQALVPSFPETGGDLAVANLADQAAQVEHAIHPQAVALLLFSLAAGVGLLLVLGQMASRQLNLAARDYPALRALGMSRGQLMFTGVGEVGLTALAGGLGALALAVVASPVMPLGPARLAEPHPGIEVNVALLALALVAIVALMMLTAAWPAYQLAGVPRRLGATVSTTNRSLPVFAQLVASGAHSTPAAIGWRMAFDPGRGRTSAPVRSALVGTILAIATVAAAGVFGASLARLVATPARYGQAWDVSADGDFSPVPDQVLARVTTTPDLNYALGVHGEMVVGGVRIPAIAVAPGRGPLLFPTLLEGHPPSRPGEVVLGTATLADLHRRVGDSIEATLGSSPAALRIVGRAVFPAFGRGSFTPTDLGRGAALWPADATPAQPLPGSSGSQYNFVLVRFTPSVGVAARTALIRDLGMACAQPCTVHTAQRPTDIRNYTGVQATAPILAGVLAMFALATLAHLLVTSVNRRRRDLAVLKTLGFVRRQVSSSVAWQATAFTAVSLIAGLPLGIAAGRWLWQVFAASLGVATDPRVPGLALGLTIPVTLALANVIAAGPGMVAGRLRPATVLRSE